MIIVKLMGGLGNQMFQYATGKYLADKNKSILKFDLSFLANTPKGDTVRNYALEAFDIPYYIATQDDIREFTGQKPKAFLKKIQFKFNKLVKQPTFIRENSSLFNPAVLNYKGNCYLEGFWQSEKYFIKIEDIIRSDFQFKHPPHQEILSLHGKIVSSNSVSIHVRRGDYVTNKAANSFHGLCSMAYYEEGIMRIAEKVPNPVFFIFSDDIDWVKENLNIGFPHVFVKNGPAVPDYEDLRLMSSCKHHIIANSSFSWWGAWLNNSKTKTVIAPSRWFLSDLDTQDLIPESWIRIKN